MNKAYIVLYNGIVSNEGYDTEIKAINFIVNRSDDPIRVSGWRWIDKHYNEYQIKEINVK